MTAAATPAAGRCRSAHENWAFLRKTPLAATEKLRFATNRALRARGPDASHSGGTHCVFYCQPLPQTILPGARPEKTYSAQRSLSARVFRGPPPAVLCKASSNLRVPSGTSHRPGVAVARATLRVAISQLADQFPGIRPPQNCSTQQSLPARLFQPSRRNGRTVASPRDGSATFASLICARAGDGPKTAIRNTPRSPIARPSAAPRGGAVS